MAKPVLLRCIYPRIGLIADTRLRGTVRADYHLLLKMDHLGDARVSARHLVLAHGFRHDSILDLTTIITDFLAAREHKEMDNFFSNATAIFSKKVSSEILFEWRNSLLKVMR